MKSKKPNKPYWEMTTAELREATKEYDKEFSGMKTVPVPPEELAKHRRFMKKLRRRKIQASRRITITIERSLFRRLDSYAKRTGMTRSAAIAAGVGRLLEAERRLVGRPS